MDHQVLLFRIQKYLFSRFQKFEVKKVRSLAATGFLKRIKGSGDDTFREMLRCVMSVPSCLEVSGNARGQSWCPVPPVSPHQRNRPVRWALPQPTSAHRRRLAAVRDACAWTAGGEGRVSFVASGTSSWVGQWQRLPPQRRAAPHGGIGTGQLCRAVGAPVVSDCTVPRETVPELCCNR